MNGFSDVEAPKAQIAATGKGAIRVGYHDADVNKPAEIEAMFAYAGAEFDGVDILVNNAGTQYTANVEDFSTECWNAIVAVNPTSAFHTMRLTVSGVEHENWSRIVNITSTHGLVVSAQKSAYVTAKHGIVGFTKPVALKTTQAGITPNTICPGWMLTPLVQKQIDVRAEKDSLPILEAKTDLLTRRRPSREFVTPDQLGALTVFLCSDVAEQVRDMAWNMDDGWVAQ